MAFSEAVYHNTPEPQGLSIIPVRRAGFLNMYDLNTVVVWTGMGWTSEAGWVAASRGGCLAMGPTRAQSAMH